MIDKLTELQNYRIATNRSMRFVALLKTDKINCKLSLINGTNGAKPLVPTLPPQPPEGG